MRRVPIESEETRRLRLKHDIDVLRDRLKCTQEGLTSEVATLRASLDAIASVGSVNLQHHYPHELRDVIRSMTDCARDALG